MSKFSDLDAQATPTSDDIIAIEQDSDGVNKKVKFSEMPIVTDLASTANGKGASLVGIEDSAAYFSSTDVEGALAELFIMMDGIDEWVSATSYSIGDVVWLSTNNVVYRATTANSDVTFTPSNWQAIGKDRFTTANDAITGANQTITAITAEVIRLTSGTLTSIDMIPQGIGQQLFIINKTGNAVDINNETGATANQQIITGTGSTISLPDDQAIHVVYDETTSKWEVIGFQDIGNAVQIQGVDVHTAAPTDGQVLTYSNANSRYEPQTPTGGSGTLSNLNMQNIMYNQLGSDLLNPGSTAQKIQFDPINIGDTGEDILTVDNTTDTDLTAFKAAEECIAIATFSAASVLALGEFRTHRNGSVIMENDTANVANGRAEVVVCLKMAINDTFSFHLSPGNSLTLTDTVSLSVTAIATAIPNSALSLKTQELRYFQLGTDLVNDGTTSNLIAYNLANITDSDAANLITTSNVSNETRFTAGEDVVLIGSFSYSSDGTGPTDFTRSVIKKNGTDRFEGSTTLNSAARKAGTYMPMTLGNTDYLSIGTGPTGDWGTDHTSFTIIAMAIDLNGGTEQLQVQEIHDNGTVTLPNNGSTNDLLAFPLDSMTKSTTIGDKKLVSVKNVSDTTYFTMREDVFSFMTLGAPVSGASYMTTCLDVNRGEYILHGDQTENQDNSRNVTGFPLVQVKGDVVNWNTTALADVKDADDVSLSGIFIKRTVE